MTAGQEGFSLAECLKTELLLFEPEADESHQAIVLERLSQKSVPTKKPTARVGLGMSDGAYYSQRSTLMSQFLILIVPF